MISRKKKWVIGEVAQRAAMLDSLKDSVYPQKPSENNYFLVLRIGNIML